MDDKTGRTIAREVTLTGVGLHTGESVQTTLRPKESPGIEFVREDLSGQPRIPADIHHHAFDQRRTVLRKGEADIHTPEHLLATLFALGLDRAAIHIWGREVPGLDGSAREWAEAIGEAGIEDAGQCAGGIVLDGAVAVTRGNAAIAAVPAVNGLQVIYSLDHDNNIIPPQTLSLTVTPAVFLTEIAPSRTFVQEWEVKALQAAGLGKGANYENTLVVGEQGIIGNTLRFEDEFARHKMLDFLGDLSLLACPIQAHVACLRSGHELNALFVKKLAKSAEYHRNP